MATRPTVSCAKSASSKPKSGPEILKFALNQRPKATRAGLPKSRAGKRHVKCDEVRPSCRRCIKWQGYCEGYGSKPLPRPEEASLVVRDKEQTPSESSSQRSSSVERRATSPPSPCHSEDVLVRKDSAGLREPNYDASFLANNCDKLYFDNWLAVSAGLGGGWFPSRLWTHTIPALSRDEPAVRYAAMAIGAMVQASHVDGRLPLMPKRILAATDTHYSNALAYYGKSLRMLQTQVAQRPDSALRLRAAALACILYTSFELMHGNKYAAMSHIAHGLRMVESFLRSYSTKGVQAAEIAQTQEPPQQSQPKEPPDGPRLVDICNSPAPLILEDEIVQTFQRLDFQAWSWGIMRPHRTLTGSPVHAATFPVSEACLSATAAVPIPDAFAKLEDARRYFAVIQQRALDFPRWAVARIREMHRGGLNIDLDLCDVPNIKEAQQHSLEELERWARAFAPLHAAARLDKRIVAGGDEMYLQATSLRLQYLLCWMAVWSIAFTDYKMIYLMTPQYRELLKLSKILLPKQEERFNQQKGSGPEVGDGATSWAGGIFTLDNGPVLALFLTAVKCRNAELRDEATKLLDAHPRREGFWESRFAAAIGWRNVPLEEGFDTIGDLTEQWAKLRLREGIIDETASDGKTRMLLFAPRRNPETGDFFLWKTSMTLDDLEGGWVEHTD